MGVVGFSEFGGLGGQGGWTFGGQRFWWVMGMVWLGRGGVVEGGCFGDSNLFTVGDWCSEMLLALGGHFFWAFSCAMFLGCKFLGATSLVD